MPTKFPEIFEALSARFRKEDERYIDKGGKRLWFANPRAFQNRLDEVLGPENWDDQYAAVRDGGWICKLTITLPDGSKMVKSGVGSVRDKMEGGQSEKTGESSSFKRACYKVGIGRYLYENGVPDYRRSFGDAGKAPQSPQEPASRAERLTRWAEKEGRQNQLQALLAGFGLACARDATEDQALKIYQVMSRTQKPAQVAAMTPRDRERAEAKAEVDRALGASATGALGDRKPGHNSNGRPVNFGWPHARSLYPWCKNIEQAFGVSILAGIRDRYEGNIVEWTEEQVQTVALEIATMVSKLDGYKGQFDHKLPNLEELQRRVWGLGGKICEQLGEDPTSQNVQKKLEQYSTILTPDVGGGEILTDIEACQNVRLLQALEDLLTGDVEAGRVL